MVLPGRRGRARYLSKKYSKLTNKYRRKGRRTRTVNLRREKKSYIVSAGTAIALPADNNVPTPYPFCGISQGDDATNRDGRVIFCDRIQGTIFVNWHTVEATVLQSSMRCIIIRSLDRAATPPPLTSVLYDVVNGTVSPFKRKDNITSTRFKVLYDKKWIMGKYPTTSSAQWGSAPTGKFLSINLRPKCRVTFEGVGAADGAYNQIYMYIFTGATMVNDVQATWTIRNWFRDV